MDKRQKMTLKLFTFSSPKQKEMYFFANFFKHRIICDRPSVPSSVISENESASLKA